jgi:hypothetical protein
VIESSLSLTLIQIELALGAGHVAEAGPVEYVQFHDGLLGASVEAPVSVIV